ncbi:ISNCY family transposase [Sharpea azabuensis]|uniref:ISNCY family transposase n=1 Tax=Sharpea azabuensis TaxID=322505 RepID=UPI002409A5FC|nr:ISNCY family transposase [Sharpea azabuensis]MDD6512476.1 ISNCY family transposase [Sharpea azabuensis]
MRKVNLNYMEEYKYKVIKKLVETNGNKKRAALRLNCIVRNVNRLIARYKEGGKAAFQHKNKGRKPAITFSSEAKKQIIDLYKEKYGDTNFRHFTEIVYEKLGVKVSDTTVNKWLREEDILSPKARRKTKKQHRKLMKMRLKSARSEKEKNKIKEVIYKVEKSEAHPRRPRCKYTGEMIQMDASSYKWNGSDTWHLHVAIDDATGEIVGAYFDLQETLKGYYGVVSQILLNKGIPALFYTDRRTVFEYKRKNAPLDNEDTFTQFAYSAHQLGIEIKTTSVAQSKGRVERVNQILQSRLPVELRRARITTIEQANQFLLGYIKKFNDQFALRLNSTKSVYEKQLTSAQINKALTVIDNRKIDKGHSFQYNKQHYMIVTAAGADVYFSEGTEVMVIKCLDDKVYANINDKLYNIREIENWEEYSENFDVRPELKKEKKKYIPLVDHPWRQNSWKLYSSSIRAHLYGAHN